MAIYTVLVKRVFENDKISYVFESQKSRLTSLNRELEAELSKHLIAAKGLVASFDSNGKVPPAALALFNENSSFLSFEVWDDINKKIIFHVNKGNSSLPRPGRTNEKVTLGEVKLLPLPDQKFLLVFRTGEDRRSPYLARVFIDVRNFLQTNTTNQSILLLKGGQILATANTLSFATSFLNKLAGTFGENEVEPSKLWRVGSQKYLVSSQKLAIGDLKTVIFTPEREALGALDTLFSRSLIFLVLSAFCLVAISLIVSAKITYRLKSLARAAEEMRHGKFSKATALEGNDEVGVLSKAFQKTSHEFESLLNDTRENTKMEIARQTTQLVQETLLPKTNTHKLNQMEVSGLMKVANRYGGDWWYCFTQGDDIYVAIADTAKHGTSGALLTAATRAIFSRLENESLSLLDMMKAWDRAISSCSSQKVYMTAILMKINSLTGEGSFLSAGHRSPCLFNPTEDGHSGEFLKMDIQPFLGEGLESLREHCFNLGKGSSLILFTDGLFSTEPQGTLSPAHFLKTMGGSIEFASNVEQMSELAFRVFENYRRQTPLPDDVTVISIRRQAPQREALLLDDSGSYRYVEL